MKVLAVTCYTGGKDLCEMALKMLLALKKCVPTGIDFRESAVAQGAETCVGGYYTTVVEKNIGFAFGMNAAIENAHDWDPDYVLCLNTDLEFPNKDWLRKLLEIAVDPAEQIAVPATNNAAIRIQQGPRSLSSYPVQESSAYCWLIPFAWCKWLKEKHGFWLFSEDFGVAYGEDNWTSFLLSKKFGPKIFRYVPRSFVKHLRARTSRTVKHDRKRSNRVLVDKLKIELQDPKIRGDLKLWAKRYIHILSGRL